MKQIKAFTVATIFTFTSAVGFGAGTEVGVVVRQSPTPTPVPKSQANITDSSKNTQKDNKSGQMLNTVIGALNFGIAASYVPPCASGDGGSCAMAALFFLMGAQNMAQAGAQGKTGGQAGGTVGATDIGLGGSGYDPNAVNQLGNDPEIKAGTAFAGTVAAGKGGFTYDPKTNTVTTPKGTKIKGSDLSSASAMEAAGIPKSAIDMMSSKEAELLAKAQKKIDKLGLNTNVVGGEESSSGGGGGITAGSGGMDQPGYGLPGAGAGAGSGIDRDPAQVAGMQKNYNGEPIGVSADSIFKMMTRRYKVKESQSTFLDESDVLVQK